MLKKWIIIFFALIGISSISYAIEKAERISDREIVERLAKLETKLDGVNQRFDDINKRFDDMSNSFNKRFDELRGFMIWGFGVTFAGMWTLMGFVLWDRRTALAPAVRKTKELEEREEVSERWRKMVDTALKELAGVDTKVAGVLKHVGLL